MYNNTAVKIHKTLQAKASLGRCQRCSLKFSQRSLFIAVACNQASNLTFIASYMIITVNHIQIANKSECTQYFKAIEVVNEVTTAECTDGIPQLQKALFKSIFQDLILEVIPFKTVANIKAIKGMYNILL